MKPFVFWAKGQYLQNDPMATYEFDAKGSDIDWICRDPKKNDSLFKIECLYKMIDGDLQLCWNTESGVRPTEMTTKAGDDRFLMRFRRVAFPAIQAAPPPVPVAPKR